MLALDIRQVSKRDRAGIPGCSAGVDALRGIDLQLRAGEVCGVVGPPGAGKSTLLLCASGAMRPDSGTVMWFGRPAIRHTPECPTAYIPDGPGSYPFLTVRDVLNSHPCMRTLAPDEQAARMGEAIRIADLLPWVDVRVSGIPAGVGRRLAIARQLLGGPQLLIIDEPFAGPETVGRPAVTELLRALTRQGITVLIASRDGRAIARASSRVVAMSAGCLHGEIDPARLHLPGRVAEEAR